MPALKILTYNILNGGEARLDAITALIRTHRPHVVALQEANSLENARRLAADLGMELFYGEANTEYAVAWLSSLPLVGWRNHRQPVFAKTLLEIGLAWEGSSLPLFTTHLIYGKTEEMEQPRVDEVRAILDILNQYRGRPHLLCGDLNSLHPRDGPAQPPSGVEKGYLARRPIAALLAAGYTDCYRAAHPNEPGYTYPAGAPWMRIDYLFASPALAARLSACDVDTSPTARRASDHLPVWAAFMEK